MGQMFHFGRRFLPFLLRQLKVQDCQKQAAALTYMSLFALVPLVTVTYSLFSIVPSFQSVGADLQGMLFENFLPEAGQELQGYLQDFSSQARNLTAFGVLVLGFTAYMMLRTIEKTFNGIWGVEQGRKGIHSFLLYWAVLSLGPLMLGAAVMMGTYLMSIKILTSGAAGGVIAFAFTYVPWLLNAAAFTLLFVAVPNCRVPVRSAMIGGIVTTIGFELLKEGFGAFVANTSFKAIYGAFALIPLFLLWINLLWMIILVGAILVRALSTYKTTGLAQQYPDLVAALLALWKFHTKQATGDVTNESDLVAAGVAPMQWRRLSKYFVNRRLMVITDNEEYVLSRDLHTLTLAELADIIEVQSQLPGESDYLQQFKWFPDIAGRLLAIDQHSEQQFSVVLGELFQNSDEPLRDGLSAEDRQELESMTMATATSDIITDEELASHGDDNER